MRHLRSYMRGVKGAALLLLLNYQGGVVVSVLFRQVVRELLVETSFGPIALVAPWTAPFGLGRLEEPTLWLWLRLTPSTRKTHTAT